MGKFLGGRWTIWLQNTGLGLAACLVFFLLAEAGMRLAGLSFPVFDIYDDVRGVKLMPGKQGWYRKEGEAFLRINSLGYRDREHDLAKPSGTFRIAILGDSFTEARQMPIEATYWHNLGERLSTCPILADMDIEVLNFGIGGYSTSQELLTYDLDARRFEPDLVLLGFFAGNDVRENSNALSKGTQNWLSTKPFHQLHDGELELLPQEELPAWKRWIYDGVQHFRMLELVNEARRQWSVRKQIANQETRDALVEVGISAAVYKPPETPEMTDAWELTARLLAELDRKARDDGARFMVATIPSAVQTYPDVAHRDALAAKLGVDDLLFPDRQLAMFSKEGGYPAFPLVKALQKEADDRHFHGFANTKFGLGHMNADGHQAMAKLLAPRVCKELSAQTALSSIENMPTSAVD